MPSKLQTLARGFLRKILSGFLASSNRKTHRPVACTEDLDLVWPSQSNLWSCKVEPSHAEVRLAKEPPSGVEMSFKFEARANEGDVTTDWKKIDLNGLRLLIAEDIEVNRMLLRQMLKNTGIVLFEAENGKEVIEIMKEHSVDLILMDLHMPEMDGIEATRAIREGRIKRANTDLPIVCLTADVFKETKEAIFTAGMNDFVTKPIEMRRLYQVLDHWRKQIAARTID